MKDLRSFTSLRRCISILVFLMTIVIFMNRVVAKEEYEEIIKDLPTSADFDHYLKALEMAVDFCYKHKNYVDFNLQFGLFMIEVNLKQVLLLEVTKIPAKLHSRLNIIFKKNNVVAKYYYDMVQKNRNVTNYWQYQKLSLLFFKVNTWQRRPNTLDLDLMYETKMYTSEQLANIYGTWQSYYSIVNDFDELRPTPAEIDSCLAVLALNDHSHKKARPQPICVIPYRCIHIVDGSNQFGYGLTHRILFIAVARFSRRCNLFSEIRDTYKAGQFCKRCYNEAKFIASNNFLLPDLMYEQIALCGLFGHAQFLRNSWLKSLLRFQTSQGCFRESKAIREFDENQMREDENDEWKIQRSLDFMKGQCNGHTTSMAVATLSNTLRYIIETYYMQIVEERHYVDK